MLFSAHRRQVDHSLREGLSSGLSSSSMSQDKTGQPFVNSDKSHDRTVQLFVESHEKIRNLFGPAKRANPRWLPGGDSKTRIPSWLWPKKYTKIKWNDRVAARRTSSCSSRRTPSTRSTTSSRTVIEAKLRSSWSSWKQSQRNGRIEEVSEFCLRHNCEKKISRRSRYYSGTYWQDTGIAKRN